MAHEAVTGSPATRLILTALREHGAATRSELAGRVDLSKSTVSEHVRVLLRRGAVVERAVLLSGHPGRPAHVIDLPATGGAVAVLLLRHGQDVATGPVDCAVLGPNGRLLARRTVPGGPRPVDLGIRELEHALTGAGLTHSDLRYAVLGVPMPLQLGADHAAIGADHQVIAGLASVLGSRPQDQLAATFGVPALLANDADLAALGEAMHGAGRGVADVAFVKCLSGGGVGVVRNGRLQTGGRVTAGEIAHVQVPAGAPCLCGADSCAGGGLNLWSRLHRWGSRAGSLDEVTGLAAAGHPRTLAALAAAGEELGRALAGLNLLFQPSVIVLERELGAAFPAMAAGIERSLPLSAPPWARVGVRSVLAEARPTPEFCGALVACGIHSATA